MQSYLRLLRARETRLAVATRVLLPMCWVTYNELLPLWCKSKQEEDKILAQEVATLKVRFTEQLSGKKMKEALVRVLYAEMLGHDLVHRVLLHGVVLGRRPEDVRERDRAHVRELFRRERPVLIARQRPVARVRPNAGVCDGDACSVSETDRRATNRESITILPWPESM